MLDKLNESAEVPGLRDTSTHHDQHLFVRVESIHRTGGRVNVVTLVAADSGSALPAFSAGAHVDVHLPNGLVRSYSLCNAQDEAQQYVLGILRDPNSRGGSAWIHQSIKHGDVLKISQPRNLFPLVESADKFFLIAGGIGVTPILSMIHRVKKIGKDAKLLYCARSKHAAPFLTELQNLSGPDIEIHWHFDDEHSGPPDLGHFIRDAPLDAHLYCCGPSAMLRAFESLCKERDPEYVHMERFHAEIQPTDTASDEDMCHVKLARSGISFTMDKGAPILPSIQAAGLEPEWSCGEGVCGACETKIIEGEALHRDAILNAAQRAANRTVMICVSSCKSNTLVLDI